MTRSNGIGSAARLLQRLEHPAPTVATAARRRPSGWRPAARLLSLTLLACTLAACRPEQSDPAPPPPAPAIRQLDQLPVAQRRVFLKGFPGDWRPDTDLARGAPEPPTETAAPPGARTIELPAPASLALGSTPLRDTIANRRSRHDFSNIPITAADLSFLLWSTQGVTGTTRDESSGSTRPLRAAPSGGARFPLDTFVVVNHVAGLTPGIYRYLPANHRLLVVREDPAIAAALQAACYGSQLTAAAAVTFVWAAVPCRSEWKYGCIAHKMIAIEAGHVCQNLYLAAESLGLGACALLGYHQPAVDSLIGADGADTFTIYLAVVGKTAG
jgi:SagB-type dehydrogenase family enzyme